MYRHPVVVLFFSVFLIPSGVFALLNTQPQQTGAAVLVNKNPIVAVSAPARCEQACSLSGAGNCRAGDVTANPRGDAQCAASRIGVAAFTQLTSFGNAGSCVDKADNNQCASGSCTTYQGKPVFGVAHRTFPFGTRMEVCNTKNGVCQIATVVERGPASWVKDVTVDARAELGLALLMGCNNKVPATYKVLSVPGSTQTAEASGPTQAAVEELLAAGKIQGNLGTGQGNPTAYTQVETPYGPGYLGNPNSQPYYGTQTGSSPYASASPVPISAGGSSGGTTVPVSQQIGTAPASPYSSIAANPAATNLQQTIQPQTQPPVPNAPSIAHLLVQPTRIPRSGSLFISWTSLNMRSSPVCTVRERSRVLGEGSEGSRSVAARELPTGTSRIELTCTMPNGTLYVSSQEVTVE